MGTLSPTKNIMMGSLAFYFFRFLLELIRTEKIPKRGISP
jgi:hypothetical protein